MLCPRPLMLAAAISLSVPLAATRAQQALHPQTSVSHQGTSDSNLPKLIRPDGKLTSEAFHFTTKAYEREALRLVVEQANVVAKQLQLPESLPITEATLSRAFIVGYGMSLMHPRIIGN